MNKLPIFVLVIFTLVNIEGCSKKSKTETTDGQIDIRQAAAKGGFVGAISSGSLGRKMDSRDRELARQTGIAVLQSGAEETETWENTRSGHRGRFMVHQSYTKPERSLVCRDFTHVLIIDGVEEVYTGTACRNLSDSASKWYLHY